MASRRPTAPTQSGYCREPSSAQPSRPSRSDGTAGMPRAGARAPEQPRASSGAAHAMAAGAARATPPGGARARGREAPATRGHEPARARHGGSSWGPACAAARRGAPLCGSLARRLLRRQAAAGRPAGVPRAAGSPGPPRWGRRRGRRHVILPPPPAPPAPAAAPATDGRQQAAAAAPTAAAGRGARARAGGVAAGRGSARRPALALVPPPLPAPPGAPVASARRPGDGGGAAAPRRRCGPAGRPPPPPARARRLGGARHADGPAPQPRHDSRDACDRGRRWPRRPRRAAAQSAARPARPRHVPGAGGPTDEAAPPAVHPVAPSTAQPAGRRGDGPAARAGVGDRLPAHARPPGLPWAAALRPEPCAPVLAPTQSRPGCRRETRSAPQAVGAGARLQRQRPAHVPGAICAWCAIKTVGPPYSGKLHVRWAGKGRGTRS
jgi:hypothetical protein